MSQPGGSAAKPTDRTGNPMRVKNHKKSHNSPENIASSPSKGPRWEVENACELLQFLVAKLPQQSGTSIKNQLKHGCIRVNEQVVTKHNYELNAGDLVCVLSSRESKYGLSHPKLRIIFEDDYIIAVDKGSGLHSVDTTGKGVENACSLLEAYIRRRSPQKRVYVVHRLDRDTSGVMLFAKCREAQNRLVGDWNDRVEERRYIAVAQGVFEQKSGTIDTYLYEDEHKVVHSTNDSNRGLRAITHYRVIEENGKRSLLALELETGRTNQIRVHLQSTGHPVVGDLKYGATDDCIGRLALHAETIRFRHPVTQKMMHFESPVPVEFGEIMSGEL